MPVSMYQKVVGANGCGVPLMLRQPPYKLTSGCPSQGRPPKLQSIMLRSQCSKRARNIS